jgi:hypothetical protein
MEIDVFALKEVLVALAKTFPWNRVFFLKKNMNQG